jgi:hypothetical protein
MRVQLCFLRHRGTSDIQLATRPAAGLTGLQVLSAAQSQPNDRYRFVTTVLVAGIPLCRAALKRATSSPNGEMRVGSAEEQLKGKKVSNHALIYDFAADYQILHSKGRTVVTALLAAREADTDKLNKGAV